MLKKVFIYFMYSLFIVIIMFFFMGGGEVLAQTHLSKSEMAVLMHTHQQADTQQADTHQQADTQQAKSLKIPAVFNSLCQLQN